MATASGGGIYVGAIPFDIANSIVAGNSVDGLHRRQVATSSAPSRSATATTCSAATVTGDVSGDRENVAPGLLFAALDPATGGGLVGANGAVALANRVTNPALSGGDLLAALAGRSARRSPDRGRRCQPAGHRRRREQLRAIDGGLGEQRRADRQQQRATRSAASPATTSSAASAATTRSGATTAATCWTAAPATTPSTAAQGSTWRSSAEAPRSWST